MASPVQIDPAVEAGQLADLFNELSQALDDFRLADHDPPIPPDQLTRLKDGAQAMEDRAHSFTTAAIGATLQSIQPNVANIKAITGQANDQLHVLTDVSKVISIAMSALSLGTAIAAGNLTSIASAAEALAQTLVG